eukprot:NODE_457_length_8231_cov_0.314068.p3 type:complete len:283 gc:universal NODE_457_length_8231_cov_0.314068:1179-331(-)
MTTAPFLTLSNTELWDYEYAQILYNTVTDCQTACSSSSFCAGYKYYSVTFSNASYRKRCNLYYWIQESTKTAMTGAVSAVRLDAPSRDRDCFNNYVLSNVSCNLSQSTAIYPKIEDAINECNVDDKCSAVGVRALFSTIEKVPTGKEPACVSFAKANRGTQVSYFTKIGDTSKCNKLCGVGDNYILPCTLSGTRKVPTSSKSSKSVPVDTPVSDPTSYIPVVIIVFVLVGLGLLSVFIIRRALAIRKNAIETRREKEVSTPNTESNFDKNRKAYPYSQDIII